MAGRSRKGLQDEKDRQAKKAWVSRIDNEFREEYTLA
jgi:hypothetical protein